MLVSVLVLLLLLVVSSCGAMGVESVVDMESMDTLPWPPVSMPGVIVAPSELALDVENAVLRLARVELGLGLVTWRGRDADDDDNGNDNE